MATLSKLTKQAFTAAAFVLASTGAIAKAPEAHGNTQQLSSMSAKLSVGLYSSVQQWHTNKSIASDLNGLYKQKHDQYLSKLSQELSEKLSNSATAVIENNSNL